MNMNGCGAKKIMHGSSSVGPLAMIREYPM
jgi:hypothetical protein